MKVLFYQKSDVINSSGGTEKVLISLSSALAEDGYDVTFLINEEKKGKPFFKLSEKVNFINIGGTRFKGIKKTIFKLIKSTPFLKIFRCFDEYYNTSKIVSKKIRETSPDIIILANTADLLEIAYKQDYKAPIIQMIHGFPHNIFARRSKTVLRLTLNLMKKVNVSQVLIDSYKPLMNHYYSGKVVVIPNSVPEIPASLAIDYKRKKDTYILMNVGRVTGIKNQELLLEAFAILADKYKNWDLHIWGRLDDKKYHDNIKNKISEYGLENRVLLKGITEKILEEIFNADIFAFPSLHEGFPLALTESMAIGLPSVGLKTAYGVNEIIKDRVNGLLANNNKVDFAEKLEELINSVELREKFGRNAKEHVKEFAPKRVLEKWKILIEEVVNESNKHNGK